MPNANRKRSNFVFTLCPQQSAAFLEIAKQYDRPFEELIVEALDTYIEGEKAKWLKTSLSDK